MAKIYNMLILYDYREGITLWRGEKIVLPFMRKEIPAERGTIFCLEKKKKGSPCEP